MPDTNDSRTGAKNTRLLQQSSEREGCEERADFGKKVKGIRNGEWGIGSFFTLFH